MTALGTRKLVLNIDSNDVTAQVSNARFTSAAADSDFVSFADAAAGGARAYKLEGTTVQDTAADTVWDQIWSNAGADVAGVLQPYGSAAAAPSTPHYTFNATIEEPDGDLLGGAANSSTTAKFTIDFSWPLDAKPAKVTT